MTRPWGLEQQTAEWWEDKYWAVAKQFGELNRSISELRQLRTQVRGLVDLTNHLTDVSTCWHIVGDTVYLDATKLKHLILERHYERSKKPEERRYIALSESRYL